MLTIAAPDTADHFPWHAIDADALEALERFVRDTSDLTTVVADSQKRSRLAFTGKYATITYARAIALAQRNPGHAAAQAAWDDFYRAVDVFVTTLALALESSAGALSAEHRARVDGLLQILDDEFARRTVDGPALARAAAILSASALAVSASA